MALSIKATNDHYHREIFMFLAAMILVRTVCSTHSAHLHDINIDMSTFMTDYQISRDKYLSSGDWRAVPSVYGIWRSGGTLRKTT